MHKMLLAIVVLAAALAGCGTAKPSGSAPAKATSTAAPVNTTSGSGVHRVAIAITGYAYRPATITATPGSTVVFTNRDPTAHTATTTSPGFDTGTLQQGQSRTVSLRKPGTYAFYCQFHAFMRGTVIVVK